MEYILILFICLRELMHYKERKELYDRLMAKDLTEFRRDAPAKPVNHIKNSMIKKYGGETFGYTGKS